MKRINYLLELMFGLFKDIEIWVYAMGSFLALLASAAFYSRVDTILTNFSDRIIGIVVLQGVDANIRTLAYVKIIVIYVLVLFASIIVFSLINRALFSRHRILKFEKSNIYYLAIAYHFSFLLSMIDLGANLKLVQFILIYAIIINTFLLIIKSISYDRNIYIYRLFSNRTINFISQISPFVVPVIARVVLRKDIVLVEEKYFPVYFGLWAGFFLFYALSLIAAKRLKIEEAIATKSISNAILPLFTIPLFLLIASEIQYSLSRHGYLVGIYKIVLFVIIFALLTSIWIILRITKFSAQCLSYPKISGLLFFVAVLTIAAYTNYIGQYKIPAFDMFHTGERLLPTQQMFSYGKLPFINILPTHGGSDYLIDSLFSWLNNGFSLDVLASNWIQATILTILIYILLANVFKPALSFLLILVSYASFIPFYATSSYSYGILSLIIIQLPGILQQDSKLKQSILYWLTVYFVMFWRIDFGVLVIIASLVMITVNLIFSPDDTRVWRNRRIYHLFLGFIVTTIPLAILAIAIWSIRHVNPLETLKTIYFFLNIQAQSVSYSGLSNYGQNMTVVNYVILPALALFYPINWIILKIRHDEIDQRATTLTFVAIFMLMIFTRAFQRHSLMEGLQFGLFVFLAAALPLLFLKKKEIAFFISLGIIFLYFLVTPSINLPSLNNSIQLKTWYQTEHRVSVSQTQYENIAKFLTANLMPQQTFYDFSNTPMLYILTNREFVSYIIPNLYITSEELQSEELQRLDITVQQKKMPLVIFFSPVQMFNQVDGVPNEVRSYRISEYIYRNYRPFASINGYEIWAQNGYKPDLKSISSANFAPLDDINQQFNLGLLPYYWGTFDPLNATKNTKILQEIIPGPVTITQNIPTTFSLQPDIAKGSGNYIYLRILAKQGALVTVSYGQGDIIKSSINFKAIPKDIPVDYLIRVSTQWDWLSKPNNIMKISSDSSIEIIDFNIRSGD